MKKTFCLFCIGLLLILTACSDGYKCFSDDIYGISMDYPEDWTVSCDDDDLIASFYAPNDGPSLSLFAENYLSYSVNLTLQGYLDASQTSLSFIGQSRGCGWHEVCRMGGCPKST